MMEEGLKTLAGFVALGTELVCVICIGWGAIETVLRVLAASLKRRIDQPSERRLIWRGFAVWILLALEFALAADIVRTAIAPTWDDIGQLAAIAVIRTGLNYFLEKDLNELGGVDDQPPKRTEPR